MAKASSAARAIAARARWKRAIPGPIRSVVSRRKASYSPSEKLCGLDVIKSTTATSGIAPARNGRNFSAASTGRTSAAARRLVAGGLAILINTVFALLGPTWPLSLRAASLATQAYVGVTLVTWHIVPTMRSMTVEAVSSERLSRFFSPEIAARIAPATFVIEPVPPITAKGKDQPVTVHRVLPLSQAANP